MWIVAIGWSYVVILMAATESSFTAGMMTFLVYCMIPLSILFYLTGGKRRRARRAARASSGPQAPSVADKADVGGMHTPGMRGPERAGGRDGKRGGNDSGGDDGGVGDGD